EFVPERFETNYMRWMENIHDWVISRQLWWGHQIPAWYHKTTGELYVGMEAPVDSENWVQDPDVLDTWFSSALWPFSTMGWPDTEAPDFKRYFPTNTLVTGYDIIAFWVSRMIFQSLEFTGKRPFQKALIHGLIRDEDGRKMSKSLGNGIDPMEVIDKYGADALRWFLSNGSAPGQDVRFSYDKMDAAWNFINKIWNASRFAIMNMNGLSYEEIDFSGEKTIADRWILTRLNQTVEKVTDLFEKFEFGEAGRHLYNFIWDDFCDWYIEMSKGILNGENEAAKQTTRSILAYVLDQTLRLLHPIMPFVTEKIWESVPHEGESLVIAEYPVVHPELNDEDAAKGMDVLMELIRSVRTIRSEVNTPLSKKIELLIKTNDASIETFLKENETYIERFCNPENLVISSQIEAPESAMSAVITGAEIYLPLAGLINIDEEIIRLEKEMAKWESEVKRVQGKLSNERFVSSAPEAVVQVEREKEKDYLEKREAVAERIASLKAQQ
ncbi:MAG: class I tRNA ligase family protein, partial [Carnobacterium maltaromaticum]